MLGFGDGTKILICGWMVCLWLVMEEEEPGFFKGTGESNGL